MSVPSQKLTKAEIAELNFDIQSRRYQLRECEEPCIWNYRNYFLNSSLRKLQKNCQGYFREAYYQYLMSSFNAKLYRLYIKLVSSRVSPLKQFDYYITQANKYLLIYGQLVHPGCVELISNNYYDPILKERFMELVLEHYIQNFTKNEGDLNARQKLLQIYQEIMSLKKTNKREIRYVWQSLFRFIIVEESPNFQYLITTHKKYFESNVDDVYLHLLSKNLAAAKEVYAEIKSKIPSESGECVGYVIECMEKLNASGMEAHLKKIPQHKWQWFIGGQLLKALRRNICNWAANGSL